MDSKMATKFFRATLLCLFLFLGMQTNASAQTNFEQLRAKFSNGEVFHATFEHTYIDAYTEETTKSEGSIWINEVGYKLTSEEQTIVVDGELSTVYDAARNRVIISEYEADEDDFAPSRMLSGLDETYIASEKTLANGHTQVTLETDDDFAVFVSIEIELDPQLKPLKITAYDIADNIIITTFSRGEFKTSSSGIFELDYPEDAEIIDMRY